MKVAIDTAGVQNVVEFAPIAMVAGIVVEAVDTVEAADIVVGMAIGTVRVLGAQTVFVHLGVRFQYAADFLRHPFASTRARAVVVQFGVPHLYKHSHRPQMVN